MRSGILSQGNNNFIAQLIDLNPQVSKNIGLINSREQRIQSNEGPGGSILNNQSINQKR